MKKIKEPAKIWLQNYLPDLKSLLEENIIVTLVSGYFHPIAHSGHIAMINAAAALGDVLVVAVNGPMATKRKYKYEMIPTRERMANIAEFRNVDHVLLWDCDDMASLLEQLRPTIFARGGDININTMKKVEIDICEKLGIFIHYGVGGNSKLASNSTFIGRAKAYSEMHENLDKLSEI